MAEDVAYFEEQYNAWDEEADGVPYYPDFEDELADFLRERASARAAEKAAACDGSDNLDGEPLSALDYSEMTQLDEADNEQDANEVKPANAKGITEDKSSAASPEKALTTVRFSCKLFPVCCLKHLT